MFTHGYQVFKSEARKYFICLAASVIVSFNPLFNNLSYTHLKQSQSVLMKVSDSGGSLPKRLIQRRV